MIAWFPGRQRDAALMQPDSVRSGGIIFFLDRGFPFGQNDLPISDTMSLLQTDPNAVHGASHPGMMIPQQKLKACQA